MKICRSCDAPLLLDDFHRDRSRPDGHKDICKNCKNKNNRASGINVGKPYTEEIKRQQKDLRLQRDYGITLAEYEKMVIERESKCDICGRFCSTLNVDHDHKTLMVRGLLCLTCNQALGMFQDDLLILKRAIEYLARERPAISVHSLLMRFGKL